MLWILSEELPSIFHACASCCKRYTSRFPLSFFIATTVADIFEIGPQTQFDYLIKMKGTPTFLCYDVLREPCVSREPPPEMVRRV